MDGRGGRTVDVLRQTDPRKYPRLEPGQSDAWRETLERAKRNVEARALELSLELYRREVAYQYQRVYRASKP